MNKGVCCIVVGRRVLLGISFLFFIPILYALTGVLQSSYPVLAPVHQGPEVPEVAITINVDWGEDHLPAMLKIMEEHGVKATFFLTGTFVERFPLLIQQLVEGGHELGNHGYRHVHPNTLTQEELVSLITATEVLIEEETGVKTRLFAPPYGEYNDLLLSVVHDLNYQLILWTVDTVDWQRPGSQVIRDRVLHNAEKGSIILIHPVGQTVEALEEIIVGIKEKGLTPVTLSTLLKE